MPKSADYSLGNFAFPRGWLSIALSTNITRTPVAARFCGEDVVIYRGDSGRVHVLEAYCLHMGAHLGIGAGSQTARAGLQVSGDDIRCPNHGWLFGSDGRLKQIPYSDIAVPHSLCLRRWPAEERAGCVFVWHDMENGPPDYDLPACAEWDIPGWISSQPVETGIVPVHPLEIAEHGVDKIHLANVHGADRVVEHEVKFKAQWFETRSISEQFADPNADPVQTTATARYHGPGLLLAEVDMTPRVIILFAHTAVDDGTSMGFFRVTMQTAGAAPTDAEQASLAQIHAVMHDQFEQDLTIFRYKRPGLKVVQIPGDGPFRRFRQWYSQFYQPRAKREAIHAASNGDIVTIGVHEAPWIGVPA